MLRLANGLRAGTIEPQSRVYQARNKSSPQCDTEKQAELHILQINRLVATTPRSNRTSKFGHTGECLET